MSKQRVLSILNIVTFVVMITMNVLANTLPLNGQQTGEISNRFDVLFVPANYVFGIWGVIYLFLTAFVVYQALPQQQDKPRLKRIGWLFVLANVANTAWIVLWHYEYFGLTVLATGGLLLALIGIYLRLNIGRTAVSGVERWVVDAPFSLYLGWATVALIANVTSFLDSIGWQGGGIDPRVWTVLLLLVGVGLAAAMLFRHRDIIYLGVLVWAFAGIAVKQRDVTTVLVAAAAAALIVALFILIGLIRPAPLRPLFSGR